jgi:hypothetical protein
MNPEPTLAENQSDSASESHAGIRCRNAKFIGATSAIVGVWFFL